MTNIDDLTNSEEYRDREPLRALCRRLNLILVQGEMHYAAWKALMDSYRSGQVRDGQSFFFITLEAHRLSTVLTLTTAHELIVERRWLRQLDEYQCKHCGNRFAEHLKQDHMIIADLKKSIKTLKIWRNKTIAHIDKEYYEEPEKVAKDVPIPPGDVGKIIASFRKIVLFAEELLNSEHPNEESDTAIPIIATQVRQDVVRILKILNEKAEESEEIANLRGVQKGRKSRG